MIQEKPSEKFVSIAHDIIIKEKRANIGILSDKLNLKEDALYKRLRGEVPFSLDQAIDLINNVSDPNLIQSIIIKAGYFPVAISKQSLEEGINNTLREWTVKAMSESSRLLETTHKALEDGKIDSEEHTAIGYRLEEIEKIIAAIRHLHELPR